MILARYVFTSVFFANGHFRGARDGGALEISMGVTLESLSTSEKVNLHPPTCSSPRDGEQHMVYNGMRKTKEPVSLGEIYDKAERPPNSDDEAIDQAFSKETGCYAKDAENALTSVERGTCCCGFWSPSRPATLSSLLFPTKKMVDDYTQYTDSLSCVATFPAYAYRPPSYAFDSEGKRFVIGSSGAKREKVHRKSGCADIAILVSGSIATVGISGIEKMLQRIETDLIQWIHERQFTVDVFIHIEQGAPRNISAGRWNYDTVEWPSWLQSLVIERDADTRTVKAASDCTNGGVTKMYQALKDKNMLPMDPAVGSTSLMFRRMFLAYRASQEFTKARKCVHNTYIRTMPDVEIRNFNNSLKQVLEDLNNAFSHNLEQERWMFIGSTPELYERRKTGYPLKDRCVLDDQFAIGDAESMAAYSTLFPDFREFFRYIPFYRRDMNGHTNKRLLAAHLHYRGVENMKDLPLDLKMHNV